MALVRSPTQERRHIAFNRLVAGLDANSKQNLIKEILKTLSAREAKKEDSYFRSACGIKKFFSQAAVPCIELYVKPFLKETKPFGYAFPENNYEDKILERLGEYLRSYHQPYLRDLLTHDLKGV